jgi:hypothetical protein
MTLIKIKINNWTTLYSKNNEWVNPNPKFLKPINTKLFKEYLYLFLFYLVINTKLFKEYLYLFLFYLVIIIY